MESLQYLKLKESYSQVIKLQAPTVRENNSSANNSASLKTIRHHITEHTSIAIKQQKHWRCSLSPVAKEQYSQRNR